MMSARPQFEHFLQYLPHPYLILLPDAPKFTIVAVNNAYLETVKLSEEDLIGRGILEAFPGNPEDTISKGVENLRNSLNFVIDQKESHKMPPQKHEIPIRGTTKFEIKYVNIHNIPIKDENNNITHILHSVEDMTDKKSLELSLEFERQRFNELYFQAPVCMGILKGPNHVYELANPHYLELTGAKDVIGKTIKEVLPEFEAQGLLKILDSVYETGETFIGKELLVKFDKEGKGKMVEMYQDAICQPHRDDNGNIDGIFFFFIDVTELVVARKKTEESENRYKELIENLPVATYSCDLEGRIVLYNKAAATLWGREPELGVDKWGGSWKIYSENGKPLPIDMCPMAVGIKESRKITDQELIIECPNGDKKNVMSYPVPCKDSSGQIAGVVNVIIDITARKEAENKAKETELRYQSLIEQATDAIFVADASEKFIEVNSSGCQLTGYTREEFLCLSMKDLLFKEDLRTNLSIIENLKNGKITRHELRIKRRDGKSIVLEFSGKMMKDGRFINIAHDITERKKAELKLIQSEKRLMQSQEVAHLGNWELNFETGLSIWSAEACKIFGFSPNDNKQTYSSWLSFIHPEDLATVLKLSEEANKTLSDLILNYRIILKDGTIKNIYGITKFEYDNNQKPIGLYGISLDITEAKKSEKILRESEKKFRQIVETAQEGIWVIDENNKTTFVNNKLCEILGYTEREIMENDIYFFMDDESKHFAENLLKKKKQGYTNQIHFKYISKAGKDVWTHLSVNPLFDDAGNFKGGLAMVTDITERRLTDEKLGELIKELAFQNEENEKRAAELSLSNEELVKTNKELDRFVYSVSHDLRSPLTSILGLVSFIEEDIKEPDTLEQVKMIRSSINRLDGFIKNILHYSQNNRTGLETKIIPLKKTIHDIVDSVRNIKEAWGISFEIDIEEKHPFYSDWHRFNTVVENLVSNAIKYHKNEVAGRYLKLTGTSDRDELNLSISDNGMGIDPEFHNKIFEMFYRLPGNVEGSGIGLYIVKETVEKMRGTIEIESQKGIGTTFNIKLKNLNYNGNTLQHH